jgi:hypothetical protein
MSFASRCRNERAEADTCAAFVIATADPDCKASDSETLGLLVLAEHLTCLGDSRAKH